MHQKTSSKALAKSWPYPKYQDFEARLHKSAACDSAVQALIYDPTFTDVALLVWR